MEFLIVGAGLFGSVFAREAANQGHKVKIVEKRNHIAGNIYTKEVNGINIHVYGAHIFHTSNKLIWEYVNQFAEFNRYTNSPIANYKGEIYNLPFNMNTFNKLWGIEKPEEAEKIINAQREVLGGKKPENLEEQAISLVGTDIYNKLIKEYTEKQWGRKCKDLPSFIIKRLPVRFTYDNNYFNDTYQGIPIGGYTKMVENILNHPNIEVNLNTDFFSNKKELESNVDKVIYTGPIDQYFNYKFGYLEYRSLEFKHEKIPNVDNYQGNAVVNFTDKTKKYTRIIEHKHFEFSNCKGTIITKEYPKEWNLGDEAYYPVNDIYNNGLFKKYYELAKNQEKVLFGGRLGLYRYLDMHMIIHDALEMYKKVMK